MPHLVLEYSKNIVENIDAPRLFDELHATLVAHGPFQMDDIKSRAIGYDDHRVGEGGPDGAFVHLTLLMLSGRDEATKRAVGERLHAALMALFARSWRERDCSITLEIRDMDRGTYFKSAPRGV